MAGTSFSEWITTRSDVLGYWRLGEAAGTTAEDSGPGNRDGTHQGGVTVAQPGLLARDDDKAADYNGTTGRTRVLDAAALDPSAQLTVAAIVRPDTVAATQRIVSKDAQYTLRQIVSGSWQIELKVGAAFPSATGGTPVAGAIARLVGTYDGSTIRLYMNGVEVASQAQAGAIATSANDLYLGSLGGTSEFFDGVIDEVAVLSSALTAAEVADLDALASTRVVKIRPRPGIRVVSLRGLDAYDLTERCDGLGWSSTDAGGDERAQFSVPQQWAKSAPELRQGNTVRIEDGLDVLWQGRLEENDRQVDQAERVGVTAYGLGVRLKDDQSASEVYVDRAIGQWQDMPLNEKVWQAAVPRDIATLSWATEAEGLVCAIQAEALAANTKVAAAWYAAPAGVVIGKLQYIGSQVSLPAGWGGGIYVCLADTTSGGGATFETVAPTLDGTLRTWDPANAWRYAFVEVLSNGAAVTPAAGAHRRFTRLAAFGTHGLTTRAISASEPDGVYGGDVVRNVCSRVAGIVPRLVDAPTDVIPQLVFAGQPHFDWIEELNKLFGYAWGVWGPDSALDSSTDGYLDWQVRTDDAHWYAARSDCDDLALNVEFATLFSSVVVAYRDGSGVEKTETRTLAAPELTAAGIARTAKIDGGTLTQAGAQLYGDVFLAISNGLPPARGQATISKPIRHHRRGEIMPHRLRADGSNISIPDVLPTSELLTLDAAPDKRQLFPIKRVSIDASGPVPKATVEVDQNRDLLSLLQAQLGLAAQVALGSGA